MIIGVALYRIFKQQQDIDYGGKLLKELYNDLDVNHIEEHLKKEYGVTIEVKNKYSKGKDSISLGFGLWKNKDIDLEKIRKKAWPSRK